MSGATPRPSMDPPRSVISVPPPPIPNGGFDPYAHTGSMAHRGRYSYASSAISTINSPRRVRRRKDPTPFNILIVGTTNSGKTSFLEFLKTALALPAKKQSKSTIDPDDLPRVSPSGNFVPHYLETEIDGERVGLTLWDSEGLEKNVVDLQLREMSSFLESKFEETFTEEMKVVRSPGVQDTHIHAVFLILDPSRLDRNIAAAKAAAANGQHNRGRYSPHARILGSLDEDLDLQVLRTLQGKTTVIPVISKADTVSTKHMSVLKRTVADSLKKANLDPLEALGLDDDDEGSTPDSSRIVEEDEDRASTPGEAEAKDEGEEAPVEGEGSDSPPKSGRLSGGSVRRHKASEEGAKEDEVPFLPLSILSPDIYEPDVVGRQFPWGFADPYNEEHCDFVRLKETVFSEWRGELRELSREQWYEGWRTSRLKQQGTKGHR
ncbi:d6ca6414-1f57-4269-afd7-85c6dd07724c [Thermothielavioides terrestris]|uniref:D6ca6414-1f57-4269-afd7-85c6dd07724c n=1 Tax=Thermothielavioides terrestris TaxID=2587410 RepID=A0A446BBB3_9PEZI|nr:d6ca6414-1f57-4269-afd7-85c6dd07724c [Thermothielavioides terrestris]